MKGEPGRPAGAGWAGCSGGRGGGRAGGGVGAPARAHVLPGAGRWSPARAFWAPAGRPLSPVAGSACLLSGAKAHGLDPSLLSSPASVSRPGPPGTRRGARKKVCWESPRFWQGGEGLRSSEEAKGRPRRVPRARTPDSSGLRREGAAPGPGRACARARCHSWGLLSVPGLAPCSTPPPSAARRPRAPGRPPAGVVRPVRAACPPRPLPKARRPERDGLLERAKTPWAAAAAHPHLILWVVDGCGEATSPPAQDSRAVVEVRRRRRPAGAG